MRKLSIICLFIVGSTLWLLAQQAPNNSPSTSAAASVTAIGCVLGLNGGYTLTTDAGKTFNLEGQNLQQYSGQKVRAVGTVSFSKKPGTNGKAENMVIRADRPTLTLSKIDEVAPTCNSKD
jgi:hypothetical protein